MDTDKSKEYRTGMRKLRCITSAVAISITLVSFAYSEQTVEFLQYDTETVRLDVYNPGQDNCPVVILIHGAAGIEGDRAIRYRKFATDLMNEGIIAINAHYFDSKRENWVKTIIQTINYAENIANADRERFGIVGYSLGGTIALLVCAIDNRPKALAINAGYLPSGFSKEDAANLPKTFMISGTEDKAIDTLRSLEQWFKEIGKPFQIKINEGFGHTAPMTLFDENWDSIVEFLTKNL